MGSFPPNVFLFTGHFFPENVFRPSTDPPLKTTGGNFLAWNSSVKGETLTNIDREFQHGIRGWTGAPEFARAVSAGFPFTSSLRRDTGGPARRAAAASEGQQLMPDPVTGCSPRRCARAAQRDPAECRTHA